MAFNVISRRIHDPYSVRVVDTGVDTGALAQRMLDGGYLLAPGALFRAERKPSTLMRINFATSQDAVFWKRYVEMVRRM